MRTGSTFFVLLSAAFLGGFTAFARPSTSDSPVARQVADASTAAPLVPAGGTPHTRSYFYVGGQYSAVANANGTFDAAIYSGQMYVEHLVPTTTKRRQYPLVMFHGSSE